MYGTEIYNIYYRAYEEPKHEDQEEELEFTQESAYEAWLKTTSGHQS